MRDKGVFRVETFAFELGSRLAELRAVWHDEPADSAAPGGQGFGRGWVAGELDEPAFLAETDWQPQRARDDIRDVLEKADGNCHIEFIMKDISTVRRDPKRLWQWAQIAMEEVCH